MRRTITEEEAFGRAKLEFMLIIWAEVGEAGTFEDFEVRVCGMAVVEEEKWRVVVSDRRWEAVDEVNSSGEGIPPKGIRELCLGQEGETKVHNMPVFALRTTVLTVNVRAWMAEVNVEG